MINNWERDTDMANIQMEINTQEIRGLVTIDVYLKGEDIFKYRSMTADERCSIVEIAKPRWQISIAIQSDWLTVTMLHDRTSGTTTAPESKSLAAKLKRKKFVLVRRYFIFQANTKTRPLAMMIRKATKPRKKNITFIFVSRVKSWNPSFDEKLWNEEFLVVTGMFRFWRNLVDSLSFFHLIPANIDKERLKNS